MCKCVCVRVCLLLWQYFPYKLLPCQNSFKVHLWRAQGVVSLAFWQPVLCQSACVCACARMLPCILFSKVFGFLSDFLLWSGQSWPNIIHSFHPQRERHTLHSVSTQPAAAKCKLPLDHFLLPLQQTDMFMPVRPDCKTLLTLMHRSDFMWLVHSQPFFCLYLYEHYLSSKI